MTRPLKFESLERRNLLAGGHNFDRPYDVNNDGEVNQVDVEIVANDVVGRPAKMHRREMFETLGQNAALSHQSFTDVNNDGRVSVVDILGVVNAINAPKPDVYHRWSGNGHDYAVIFRPDPDESPTFSEAQRIAEEYVVDGRRGHLVTITSQAEQDWLKINMINPHRGPEGQRWQWSGFIGLTDNEAFGGSESFERDNPRSDGWVWITGEPFEYSNWKKTPANGTDRTRSYDSDAGSINTTDWTWRDSYTNGKLATFVIEFSGTFRAEV